MTNNEYILTLSCDDTFGIVAAVSGFLASHDGFIIESAQFGDPSTGKFFMRTKFKAGPKAKDASIIAKKFSPIAKRFAMEWQLHPQAQKPQVLILVTKESHCLNDLLHRYRTGWLPMEIAGVVSNHEYLRAMTEAQNIPYFYLPVNLKNKKQQETKLLELIETLDVEVVVLARYMQVLSTALCNKLKGKAINIHHSFLPGFKGAKPYHQAYDRGVKLIGATAHYATADLDEGPIIEQEVIRVDHTHTPEMLKALGQDIERQVLARALKFHLEHRVLLNGNKTVVFR